MRPSHAGQVYKSTRWAGRLLGRRVAAEGGALAELLPTRSGALAATVGDGISSLPTRLRRYSTEVFGFGVTGVSVEMRPP